MGGCGGWAGKFVCVWVDGVGRVGKGRVAEMVDVMEVVEMVVVVVPECSWVALCQSFYYVRVLTE